MARLLYRLGLGSFRKRGFVLAVWLVLLGTFGAGAATLSEPTSDTFSLPGTEAQDGFDFLDDHFPEMSADGANANVVFAAPDGQELSEPEFQDSIENVLAELAEDPDVAALQSPFEAGTVSEDQSIAYAQIKYTVQPFELNEDTRDLLDAIGGSTTAAGVQVEVGGSAMQPQPEPPLTEIIGLIVAAIVLTVALGSLVAAGLPLATGLIGVGIGVAGVTAATAWFDLASETYMLALMLGLAVAIDYALFILTRFRHERAQGHDPETAIARAVGTAGNAVVFAGAIVCVTLVALSVVGIPFLTAMALSAAATVAVAVLIAVTLLPALAGFARNHITPSRNHKTTGEASTGTAQEAPAAANAQAGLGERWGRFVTRKRLLVLVLTVPALAALAWPATDLRLGMPDGSMAAPESTERQAYELLADGFGPGVNGPLLVATDVGETADPQATAAELAEDIAALDATAAVERPVVDSNGDAALLTVIPTSGPSSEGTETLVNDIRALGETFNERSGTPLWVTGQAAMNIDISEQLGEAMVPYLLIVVGLALLLLGVVFRSVIIPVVAASGFLLTIGATFGAVVAVFQWGWLDWLLSVDETGPIISIMPIFLVGVLFGLAMDYQLFMGTRMREEYVHGADPTGAVVGGFRLGARVVTAAATIMISVFAGFIVSDEDMIKSMGFALAFGILIDAFLIRMAIIPALMSLFGRATWWIPRWLARILPDADIEGERLVHTGAHAAPVAVTARPPGPEVGGNDDQTQATRPTRTAGATTPAVSTDAVGNPAEFADRRSAASSAELAVRGRVYRSDGVAVGHAALTLLDPTGRQADTARSAEDGTFSMVAPGPDSYILVAATETLPPRALPVLVSGEPIEIDVMLSGGGGVTGTVTDALDARPLPRALVVLTGSDGRVAGSSFTDGDGVFTITQLTSGTYTLVASADNHRPRASIVTVPAHDHAAADVQLEAFGQVHGFARVAGNGRPAADARVTLLDPDGTVLDQTVTGQDGEYQFRDLPEGEYTLLATGYRPVRSVLRVSAGRKARHELRLDYPGNGTAGLDGAPG